jgi:RNA polymerase sigma factor (sigma-70 family)
VNFEREWKTAEGSVVRLCRSMARDRDLAEDLVQQVRIRAWLTFENYKISDGPFKNLCLRMATNIYRDHLRHEGRRVDMVLCEYSALSTVPDRSAGALDSLMCEEGFTEIAANFPEHLTGLPWMLAAGFSYSEIAEYWGTTVCAVRGRLNKFRQAMNEAAA